MVCCKTINNVIVYLLCTEPPSVPTEISITAAPAAQTTILISWNISQCAVQYVVTIIKNSSDGSVYLNITTSDTNTTVTLPAGVEYCVTVLGVDSIGRRGLSSQPECLQYNESMIERTHKYISRINTIFSTIADSITESEITISNTAIVCRNLSVDIILSTDYQYSNTNCLLPQNNSIGIALAVLVPLFIILTVTITIIVIIVYICCRWRRRGLFYISNYSSEEESLICGNFSKHVDCTDCSYN